MSIIAKLLLNRWTLGAAAALGAYKYSEIAEQQDIASGKGKQGPYLNDIVDGGLQAASDAYAHYKGKPSQIPKDAVAGWNDPKTTAEIANNARDTAGELAQAGASATTSAWGAAKSAVGTVHNGVANMLVGMGVPKNWAGTAALVLEGATAIFGGSMLGIGAAKNAQGVLGGMASKGMESFLSWPMWGAGVALTVVAGMAFLSYWTSGKMGRDLNWLFGGSKSPSKEPEIQAPVRQPEQSIPTRQETPVPAMPSSAEMKNAVGNLAAQSSVPQDVNMADVTAPQRAADVADPSLQRRDSRSSTRMPI